MVKARTGSVQRAKMVSEIVRFEFLRWPEDEQAISIQDGAQATEFNGTHGMLGYVAA